MKRIGIREFKTKVTSLIADEKALVIEKHGKPVGFYIPLPKKDNTKAREAAAKLEHTLEGILNRTGMTREAFEAAWEQAGQGE